MRWLAPALIILIGIGQGYPLYGTNGLVNSTIYGAFKEPFIPGDINAGKNVKLYVDLSLGITQTEAKRIVRADYILMDMNDKAYRMRADYSKELQPGRSLIGFLVPQEAIPKNFIIKPLENLGDQFIIDFDEVTNASNNVTNFVYYGVIGSKINSNRKSIKLDVAVTNNASKNLPINAKNFTLVDQWNWRYLSQEYDNSGQSGFPAVELRPNQTVRATLIFDDLSPLSRPVNLVYNYSKNDSIVLDIDTEGGLRQGPSLSGNCQGCGGSGGLPPDTTLSGSIKETKARLAKVREAL
ncbi:MAG: DUF4352 domain-containing protein [Methanotrichaceae archaeon]|nr:DUF4352 domain-containing protein [Methanotrichaceae archaeon]